MEKWKSPNGFIVVLPGEIIEIPQDSDKSWLTLFYSLPRELAEKWKPAYDLPRCPYEVLRTDKYDHIVCDDMFKLLVWDLSLIHICVLADDIKPETALLYSLRKFLEEPSPAEDPDCSYLSNLSAITGFLLKACVSLVLLTACW